MKLNMHNITFIRGIYETFHSYVIRHKEHRNKHLKFLSKIFKKFFKIFLLCQFCDFHHSLTPHPATLGHKLMTLGHEPTHQWAGTDSRTPEIHSQLHQDTALSASMPGATAHGRASQPAMLRAAC